MTAGTAVMLYALTAWMREVAGPPAVLLPQDRGARRPARAEQAARLRAKRQRRH